MMGNNNKIFLTTITVIIVLVKGPLQSSSLLALTRVGGEHSFKRACQNSSMEVGAGSLLVIRFMLKQFLMAPHLAVS